MNLLLVYVTWLGMMRAVFDPETYRAKQEKNQ